MPRIVDRHIYSMQPYLFTNHVYYMLFPQTQLEANSRRQFLSSQFQAPLSQGHIASGPQADGLPCSLSVHFCSAPAHCMHPHNHNKTLFSGHQKIPQMV